MSCGIHLRAISQEMFQSSFLDISLEITNSRLHVHLPGANDLRLKKYTKIL